LKTLRMIIICAILIIPLGVFAQIGPDNQVFAFDSSKPVSIASDKLEVDNKLQSANFLGNVVVLQDNVMLNADMVTIHYKKDDKKPAQASSDDTENKQGNGLSAITGGSGQIRSIVAAGHVVMIQEEKRATCEQAIFDQENGLVTLTGDPTLFSGTDMLGGDKIVVHIHDQRVEVIGARNNRVRASVLPKNMKNQFPEKAQQRLKDLSKNAPEKNPPAENKEQQDTKKKPGNLMIQEPTPDG
jgi:lipopolysaccharide export system protein LptA